MKKKSIEQQLPEKTEKPSLAAWVKKNWPAILAFFLLLCVYAGQLLYANVKPETEDAAATGTPSALTSYEEAVVVNVSQDEVQLSRTNNYNYDDLETGKQVVLVRITTGDHAGELREVTNNVSTFNQIRLKTGDKIVVIQTVSTETGEIISLAVNERSRLPLILVLVGVFFLVILLVGGRTGLKSLVGLIWIFIPLLLKGAMPAPTALLLCVEVAAMCFLLLGGLNKKTITAMLGTVAGMGLAALFSLIAQKLLQINSYSMYNTDPQLDAFVTTQWQGIPLHITGLLTAGVIISALGAVMDVAMSLSSAVSELKAVNPDLTPRDLWKSGMNIGRDMVGTMTNTLILAFVGSSLVILIFIWIQNPPARLFANSSFLAVELVSGLSSSVGLILAVPITALIAAVLFGRKPRQK